MKTYIVTGSKQTGSKHFDRIDKALAYAKKKKY